MAMIEDLRAGAVQHRSAVVQDVDEAKGEIYMRAIPYGVEQDIGADILETFQPGAFARSAKEPARMSLWSGHGGPLVGRGLEAEDKPDGLWLRMKLGRTQAARDAVLDLVDGIASDPSIEFRPMRDFMRIEQRGMGYRVDHRRAHALGVALVPDGAFHGSAFVASVRDAEGDRAAEEARLWFESWRQST